MKRITGLAFVFISLFLFAASSALALTAGETYTVTLDQLSSTGSITTLGLSSEATADSSGKIAFSMNGVPTNDTCNFLVIGVQDSTGTTVRRSIVPCPDVGGTLPLGVSGLTDKQSDALVDAFAAAGTDDPILAIFGFALVRSTGLSATDLSTMATLANQGINGTNGFVDYLTSNGVSASQLATYRTAIVSLLADPDSGYVKLGKDAVDAADSATEVQKRGEAAALLLNNLVKAATTAGFAQDRVLEAFNSMGNVVMPLMTQAVANGTLSAASSQMVESNIGGGIQKLKAEKNIEKYTQALTTLGATGADVTTYTAAASTLSAAMISAFQTYEQVFNGSETQVTIAAAQTAMNTTMQAAFTQFMSSSAATDARINTMISNINTALGQNTGLSVSNFSFYDSNGTAVNWSITMVIPTDWVSNMVSAGGTLTYTRDTTSIPGTMTWRGTCSVNGYYDSASCAANGGTWTSGRTDYVAQGLPTAYASLFGLQEDVMILEFTRWASQSTAGEDMGQQAAAEKAFATNMATLAGRLGGTTDGSTAISSVQKTALVTLMQSPQF
ncbi:MAG: hypothetical protein HYS21_13050 [Deltaproteobacteria bacterium]|nr:hypothetical protein [Deltaproteobacteria bacterium]